MTQTFQQTIEAEGLVFIGMAPLEVARDYTRFRAWLNDGKHAEMAFLERYLECRQEPARLLPGARSVAIMALPYDLGDKLEASHPPRVAQYSRMVDYHRVLRRKGNDIIRGLEAKFPGAAFRAVVDSAPILERALAAHSGSGFIGKNTCYIHPRWGSFVLLAEILSTVEIGLSAVNAYDSTKRTEKGGCGTCNLCQIECPTGALDTDYTLDARKCLAYWTIEHRGTIPEEYWPHLAKYYFGCDLCQLACPYTRRASGRHLPAEFEERNLPSLYETAVMGQKEYEIYFGGTSLTRAKRSGLKRNALIAMTVTRDPRLTEALRRAAEDDGSPVKETIEQIYRYLGGNYSA